MSVAPPQPPTIATGVAPPHSIETEQSVLGGILLSDRAMPGLVLEVGLRAEHFYHDRHRAIFAAMCDLHGRGDAIDVLTVSAELERGGMLQVVGGKAAIDELTGGVPGLGGIRRYAQIVTEHWIARERLSSSYEQQAVILNHGTEEAYQAALARAHAVVAAGVDEGFLAKHALADHLEEWLKAPTGDAFPTPRELPSLARMLLLQPGQLTVIAAWPSGGKSSAALAFARAMGSVIEPVGQSVGIWSNEDSEIMLAAKHVQSVTEIPSTVITKKQMHDSRWPKILSALASLPFGVQPCYGWTAQQVATHFIQAGKPVTILDHFHNLKGIGTVGDVDEALRVLRAAAGQAKTHLIICAQLNRNRLNGVCKPPPVVADLRGSASFEFMADTILLVHRDEAELEVDGEKAGKAYKLDTGSVEVAKNKITGETGLITVLFDKKRIRFVEPAHSSHGPTSTPAPGSPEDLGF